MDQAATLDRPTSRDAAGVTRRGPVRWQRLLLPLQALAVLTASKAFNTNPVIGSPTLNRRGLHLARRRLAARIGASRRRRLTGLLSDTDRAAFERDGFIVKQDFLDPATFTAFRDEILSLDVPAREAVIGDTLTRLIALDGPTLRRLPVARAVLEGQAYRGLINYVGSFRRRPSLYVQTVFSRFAPEAEPDIQSFFHTDTFHPTVKAWFFLQDVEQDAAPFAYVPGSHRANRRKLAWERRVSITARNAGDRLTAEGSFRITEAEIRRLGYGEPRRMPVAANTLVVADTSGIHRRSTTDKPLGARLDLGLQPLQPVPALGRRRPGRAAAGQGPRAAPVLVGQRPAEGQAAQAAAVALGGEPDAVGAAGAGYGLKERVWHR